MKVEAELLFVATAVAAQAETTTVEAATKEASTAAVKMAISAEAA